MSEKSYRHGDLRRSLVGTATELVEIEGADAASIARFAQVCRASMATPYRHFDNKEAPLGKVAVAHSQLIRLMFSAELSTVLTGITQEKPLLRAVWGPHD